MRRLILIFALSTICSGCGIIYTHTVVPLTTNFDRTPAGDKNGNSDIKDFRYAFVEIQWNTNAIGDIALEQGFEELYFADLETLRVLGVWTQTWVHLYGR